MAQYNADELHEIARELASSPLLRTGDRVVVGEVANHWAEDVPLRIGQREYVVGTGTDFSTRGLTMTVAFNGREMLFALGGVTGVAHGYEHQLFAEDLDAVRDGIRILCGLNLAKRIAGHPDIQVGDRWTVNDRTYDVVKCRVPAAYGQIKYGKGIRCEGVLLATDESWVHFGVKSGTVGPRETLAAETWLNAYELIASVQATATQRWQASPPDVKRDVGLE